MFLVKSKYQQIVKLNFLSFSFFLKKLFGVEKNQNSLDEREGKIEVMWKEKIPAGPIILCTIKNKK